MSPCPKNRELIAELALGAMNAHAARELQAHIETCAGCRHYLRQISAVTKTLNAVEIRSDIQTSESFHRRVVRAVRAEARGSTWQSLLSQINGSLKNWRVALPLAGATAAIVALSVFLLNSGSGRGHKSSATFGSQAQAALTPNMKSDVDPTVANYKRVANRSLEKLDDLLASQANRNPLSTPIFTSAMVAGATLTD
jgi:anti-sigma factor RsiW